MSQTANDHQETYRLWIAGVSNDWQPQSWSDVPPHAQPIEAAIEGSFNAAQATAYLEGFNTQILRDAKPYWAVATPVAAQYPGELEPSRWISASRLLHCTATEA